jgi:hypothetical protein
MTDAFPSWVLQKFIRYQIASNRSLFLGPLMTNNALANYSFAGSTFTTPNSQLICSERVPLVDSLRLKATPAL